jgi:hypothetical protein
MRPGLNRWSFAPPAQPLAALLRAWPLVLALLASAGLLWALGRVLQGAVTQGGLRREAMAAQANAAWRCNTMADVRQRRDCRGRLGGASAGLVPDSR